MLNNRSGSTGGSPSSQIKGFANTKLTFYKNQKKEFEAHTSLFDKGKTQRSVVQPAPAIAIIDNH